MFPTSIITPNAPSICYWNCRIIIFITRITHHNTSTTPLPSLHTCLVPPEFPQPQSWLHCYTVTLSVTSSEIRCVWGLRRKLHRILICSSVEKEQTKDLVRTSTSSHHTEDEMKNCNSSNDDTTNDNGFDIKNSLLGIGIQFNSWLQGGAS